MAKLTIVNRSGEKRDVEGRAGRSVMALIREAGLDEVLAICGGCCSCATCHVHVDPVWAERLPPMRQDESDLLENSARRDATSRLSCQILFADELDGLTVRIADEE